MLDTASADSRVGPDIELIRNLDHHAFLQELASIGARLAQREQCDGEISTALWVLGRRLDLHERFQQRRLAPAFSSRQRGDRALFEAWAFDALKLFGAIDLVRRRYRYCDLDAELSDAIERLIRRVQDHLSAEAGVLAPWSGVGST